MPRPKPDQIIRHQIVFGEADRKILDRAIDSYTISQLSRNAVTLMNDVTGTATFLALIAASGILGVTFAFSASAVAIAGGGSSVFDEFYTVWKGERDKAKADKARDRAKAVSKAGGRAIDPFPGNPFATIIDLLIPDEAVYGSSD